MENEIIINKTSVLPHFDNFSDDNNVIVRKKYCVIHEVERFGLPITGVVYYFRANKPPPPPLPQDLKTCFRIEARKKVRCRSIIFSSEWKKIVKNDTTASNRV